MPAMSRATQREPDVSIRNVSIFDSHPRPFFAAGNLSCAISAGFRVHNPHGCQVQLGEEPEQRHVDVAYECLSG